MLLSLQATGFCPVSPSRYAKPKPTVRFSHSDPDAKAQQKSELIRTLKGGLAALLVALGGLFVSNHIDRSTPEGESRNAAVAGATGALCVAAFLGTQVRHALRANRKSSS